MSDPIDRQEAIDVPEEFIKDCNPEHFVGHQKFIEFMDNAEIGSFGNWQFANGFNLGLTAAEVAIEKLPSAQPERKSRIITNADRIRAMSDEELAEFFPSTSSEFSCHPGATISDCGEAGGWWAGCQKCWLDWLKQEVNYGN